MTYLKNFKIKKFTRNSKFEIRNSRSGFSLVEVLVASAIVTIVMLSAIGAVMTIQDANRKAQAVRAIIDNLHGALENMSRKIRTGNSYHCGVDQLGKFDIVEPQDCSSTNGGSDTSFAFMQSEDVDTGAEGQPIVYSLRCIDPTGNLNNTSAPSPKSGDCTNRQGTIMYYNKNTFSIYEPLIDPKINVRSLRFYVHNADGAKGYPSVLITLAGSIKIERMNIETPFNIQTTISQYIK